MDVRHTCSACGEIYLYHKNSKCGFFNYKFYCQECLEELRDGKIRIDRAKLDSSGGGCPLEPNQDDASPWQENAIKDMEG